MSSRLFYKVSTGQWLHRIDWCEALPFAASEQDAIARAALAFGIPASDIAILETDALTRQDREERLGPAVDWAGVPPSIPMPSAMATGQRLSPLPVSRATSPLDQAVEQVIDALDAQRQQDGRPALTDTARAALRGPLRDLRIVGQ